MVQSKQVKKKPDAKMPKQKVSVKVKKVTSIWKKGTKFSMVDFRIKGGFDILFPEPKDRMNKYRMVTEVLRLYTKIKYLRVVPLSERNLPSKIRGKPPTEYECLMDLDMDVNEPVFKKVEKVYVCSQCREMVSGENLKFCGKCGGGLMDTNGGNGNGI
jgi:hypothetical protein